jgi:hypothetical protein
MGQQVNIKCKQYIYIYIYIYICLGKSIAKVATKYLKLGPKLSDLTIIRIIKVRMGYRCKDIQGIVVSW